MKANEFKIMDALTFDDVSLVPAYSRILPKDVSLCLELSPGCTLPVPLLSAAMDTVTESRMAIALARFGGMGVIHKNCSPEIQSREVERVKKSEAAVISQPISILPETPVKDAIAMMKKHGISGFPVVDATDTLVGILTHRDIRFIDESGPQATQPISALMTPRDRLVTIAEGADTLQARDLLNKNRIEKLPVVDRAGKLKGLMTVKDITKSASFPNANKDAMGRLRVAAALGVGKDLEERSQRLLAAGVDAFVVDTAHGHSASVIEAVGFLRTRYKLPIIAGNVVTPDATEALFQAGADVVKVGVGPGSICTTRMVAGVGVPQFTAIFECANVARRWKRHIIADGGIKHSGDIVKAFAAGASAVMVGSLLAGCEESPGEMMYFQGRPYKTYRGMGSLSAMQAGSAERYFQDGGSAENAIKLVPEGVEGRVPFRGAVDAVLTQLVGGVRSGFGYTGSADIPSLWKNAVFVRVTAQGLREAHVHDVSVTKEAPNYRWE